jgi:Uncharacterized conserved protein
MFKKIDVSAVQAVKRSIAKFALVGIASFGAAFVSQVAVAEKYVIDTKGSHAFIQFRVKHLGYSWLYGRFNTFSGEFHYDPAAPEASKVKVDVDVTSLDTNHALRESHLADKKYLNSKKFPKASFQSTAYKVTEGSKGVLEGNLTLMGVTKPITVDVEYIGGGKDPWGGFRQGFEGRATIMPKDWGLDLGSKLGVASANVELILSVEGIKQ